MLFKDISILSWDEHFVQQSRTFCVILVEGIMRKIAVKLFKFEPVVQEKMSFKDISILSWGDQNGLCNFGGVYYERRR